MCGHFGFCFFPAKLAALKGWSVIPDKILSDMIFVSPVCGFDDPDSLCSSDWASDCISCTSLWQMNGLSPFYLYIISMWLFAAGVKTDASLLDTETQLKLAGFPCVQTDTGTDSCIWHNWCILERGVFVSPHPVCHVKHDFFPLMRWHNRGVNAIITHLIKRTGTICGDAMPLYQS